MRKFLVGAIGLFSFLGSLQAQTTTPANPWYVGAGLGLVATQKTGKTNVAMGDKASTSLHGKGTNSTFGFSLEGGYQYSLSQHKNWFTQQRFGAQLEMVSGLKVKGDRTTVAATDAPFPYQYKAGITLLQATYQATLYQWQQWQLFAKAGIGLAQVSTSGYKQTPQEAANDNVSFSNKSQLNPAYSVGLGTYYQLQPNMQLGFTYTYQDLGKAVLGGGTFPKFPSGTGTTGKVKQLLDTSSMMLSFVYEFGGKA